VARSLGFGSRSRGGDEKSALLEACKTRDIGRDKATKLIGQLIAKGKLHQVQVPRSGARPEVHLAHGPGPEEATPEQASPDCQSTLPSEKPPGPPPCPLVLESGGLGNRVSTAVTTGLEQPVATPVATHQLDDLLPPVVTTDCPPLGGSRNSRRNILRLEKEEHPTERQGERSMSEVSRRRYLIHPACRGEVPWLGWKQRPTHSPTSMVSLILVPMAGYSAFHPRGEDRTSPTALQFLQRSAKSLAAEGADGSLIVVPEAPPACRASSGAR
jgi:hypothetical protein